jgi:lipopolysaccharide transport system ATP-binding protein
MVNMGTPIVIRANSLGKKYVIGHEADRKSYTALRDIISRKARNVLRTTSDMLRGRAVVTGDTTEEFWALKGVDFAITRGEVVGIIGRNGAGKSTLLKILSRITEPTEGQVEIRGRVASLLEVGTGFHPELSGRENIYLNGAILGMTRTEIQQKFAEIVAFAEVERFLDTPVKRYSSGMYVRLAFAVAAHLEPEILIIDEVLAVGDAEFQKKCLGKMSAVAKEGRTVLFVSHNLDAVRLLCSRVLILGNGTVIGSYSAEKSIKHYLESIRNNSSGRAHRSWTDENAPGDESLKIRKVTLLTEDGKATTELRCDEEFRVLCEYEQMQPLRGIRINLRLEISNGQVAFQTSDHIQRPSEGYPAGAYTSICHIPKNLLNRSMYSIMMSVDLPGVRVIQDWFHIGGIEVSGPHNGGTSFKDSEWPGVVSPRCSWTVERKSALADVCATGPLQSCS